MSHTVCHKHGVTDIISHTLCHILIGTHIFRKVENVSQRAYLTKHQSNASLLIKYFNKNEIVSF